MTALLLLDGLYLAGAMYATGGTQSPIRFLVYLHLVAVSLLASYRTGLKIALWDSLLLFVVLYAQAARLVAAGRRHARRRPSSSTGCRSSTSPSFWLFAIATSIFSALNERELRQRRADLQALVDVGRQARRGRATPIQQAEHRPGGLVDRFGFERGVAPRRVRRPGRRPRHPRARPTPRRPPSDAGLDRPARLGAPRDPPGQAARRRPATRSWPRCCRTPATSSSRR